MRGLLVMMLIFVSGSAAAIWWGASLLRTRATLTDTPAVTQPEESRTTVATRLNPLAEPQPVESERRSATSEPQSDESELVQQAQPPVADTAQPAEAMPVLETQPTLQHTRVDPLAHAEAALERDPLHPLALRDAARLSLEQGDSQAASTYLARLIVVQPEDNTARRQLAKLAAEGNAWTTVHDALQPIPEAQRHLPDWRMLAEAFSATGQLQAARDAWSQVLQDDPDDQAAQLALANVLFEMGLPTEARQQVVALLESQPSSVPALNLLAAIHWQQYEDSHFSDSAAKQAAVTAWQTALGIDPAQPELRTLLVSLSEQDSPAEGDSGEGN